jgi:hypothetical protein
MFLFFFVVGIWHGFDWWSLWAGVIGASGITLVLNTRDEPPQHVQNWKRGAEGERKTEKALRVLERRGWKVEHDIQRHGRANLDHVVTGPPGVFLLETKILSGTILFEDGVLVARQFDDPDEIYRYKTLAARLGWQASELSGRLRAETGRGVWVTTVVVIWGNFPTEPTTHGTVTYIRGDELTDWLTKTSGPMPSTRVARIVG